MIKAIIFDCFGVLAKDGWTPFKREHIVPGSDMERAVAEIGRQSDIGSISRGNTTHQMSELMGVGENALKQALSGKHPNEELLTYIKNELKPKYKIGLMSNANYDVVADLFTKEQAGLFHAHILSYNTHLAKPDKRMYELAAERLGVSMSECLFVDDQQRYCEVAEGLGMRAMVFVSTAQFKKDLPARVNN